MYVCIYVLNHNLFFGLLNQTSHHILVFLSPIPISEKKMLEVNIFFVIRRVEIEGYICIYMSFLVSFLYNFL